MAWIGPVAGALLGGIFGNAQNKANQQAATNAQNQAGAQQQQALAQAFQQQQQARQQALQALQQYQNQNPNPSSFLSPIHGPPQMQMPSFGGATLGHNGMPQQPQGAAQQFLLPLLMSLFQSHGQGAGIQIPLGGGQQRSSLPGMRQQIPGQQSALPGQRTQLPGSTPPTPPPLIEGLPSQRSIVPPVRRIMLGSE